MIENKYNPFLTSIDNGQGDNNYKATRSKDRMVIYFVWQRTDFEAHELGISPLERHILFPKINFSSAKHEPFEQTEPQKAGKIFDVKKLAI